MTGREQKSFSHTNEKNFLEGQLPGPFCDCFSDTAQAILRTLKSCRRRSGFVRVPFRKPHFQQLGSLQGMKNLCRQTLIAAIFYSALWLECCGEKINSKYDVKWNPELCWRRECSRRQSLGPVQPAGREWRKPDASKSEPQEARLRLSLLFWSGCDFSSPKQEAPQKAGVGLRCDDAPSLSAIASWL